MSTNAQKVIERTYDATGNMQTKEICNQEMFQCMQRCDKFFHPPMGGVGFCVYWKPKICEQIFPKKGTIDTSKK